MKEFIIQKNEENQRLDKYLKKLLPNAGTSFLYKMMRKKNIVLNKKKVEGSEKLVAGDVVSLFLSDETFDKFHVNPEILKAEYKKLSGIGLKNLKIVYEDDEMIIADKPYNMLSQKSFREQNLPAIPDNHIHQQLFCQVIFHLRIILLLQVILKMTC